MNIILFFCGILAVEMINREIIGLEHIELRNFANVKLNIENTDENLNFYLSSKSLEDIKIVTEIIKVKEFDIKECVK